MEDRHRTLLRTMRVYLLNNITRLEEVLDFLESDRIISEDQRHRIMSHSVHKDRLRYFLDTIVRCGPLAFDKFQNALRETHQEVIIHAMQMELDKTVQATQVTMPSTTSTTNKSAGWDTHSLMMPDKLGTHVVHPFEPYPVTSLPRGYILIINIENYTKETGFSNRLGSAEDVKKLMYMFQDFSYSVAVLQDPIGRQLEQAVMEFALKPEHSRVHAGGLIILAHGIEHHIVATDGTLVSIDGLISWFTNPKCPGLVQKPKLLVIQACRGAQHDRGVITRAEQSLTSADFSTVDHSLDPSSWLSVPYMSDCVIVYSTLPGFVSWRSETSGSWYITTFVDVFRLHGHRCHVMDLLAEVNQRLVNESSDLKLYQISQPVSTLRKPFFLSTKTTD
ncbi:hypothetical protein EG68_09261 [Paragonimus skrjabini miyazakii]|uniref:Caspase-2 n=1 Tax=Paragonimus skrjabini miyazakii TaxID=59628 RepID=A0A8S9Y8D7_9TREM|nr:hypothetical protein EG68_09261 [Paragonimus skrjabini miyazakii]